MPCPSLTELPPPPPGKTGWPWAEASPPLPETTPNGEPWPRVSIVTPSFNQGQFIEETIRSVLLQGYPNLEYIIVDGGSTDGSAEVIRKYEPWLASWVSEPDRGQTHAINKGWARATGDILAYINSDDCYLDGAIAAAAREFCAKPGTGMVYGTAMVVNEGGEALRTWEAHPFDLSRMLMVGNAVPQPATFFSQSALKRVGYLDEEWHMIMDYALCVHVGLLFQSSCVPQTLARFRDHAQSKSRMRFESMGMELMRFVAVLHTDQLTPQELRTIKRATLSRIHYEWALAHLVQGRREKRMALWKLFESIRLHHQFAFGRPRQTAYIVKEVLLSYLTMERNELTVIPDRGVGKSR